MSVDDLGSFPLYFSLIQFRYILEVSQVCPEAVETTNAKLKQVPPLKFTFTQISWSARVFKSQALYKVFPL